MHIAGIFAIIIFIFGYILITIEHKIGTHKSAISLALGASLWILASFSVNKNELSHAVHEAGTEVFGILAFLLSAMTLVEILIHYRFFDIIRIKLSSLKLNDRKQFLMMCLLTFFLSAILDNLTVTIVMIQIARRFFKEKNLLIAAAGIVVLANAGGAWSPIGDVTTIMLWLAHKFSALDIILKGFLPSAILGIISSLMLVRKMDDTSFEIREEMSIKLSKGEKIIIFFSIVSFSFPLFMNMLGLPPYMGLLLGLGFSWLLIEFIRTKSHKETHLEANIERLLQKTDIASLKFFVGILLSVSALQTLGVLEMVSHTIIGENPDFNRLVIGNSVLGLLSAIVDNVPLTALAIDIIKVNNPEIWVLTALTVGTGGSALVIGSVSGVVAMGMIKGLTFEKYLKIATLPAIVGYVAAIGVWLLQYQIFG